MSHINHAEAIISSSSRSYRMPALSCGVVQEVSQAQVQQWESRWEKGKCISGSLKLYPWAGSFTMPPSNCAGNAGPTDCPLAAARQILQNALYDRLSLQSFTGDGANGRIGFVFQEDFSCDIFFSRRGIPEAPPEFTDEEGSDSEDSDDDPAATNRAVRKRAAAAMRA